MSERTHSNPLGAAAPRKSKLFPILAGTAAAVLVAGVAFQVYRAEYADAQTRATPPDAGSARLQDSTTPTTDTGSAIVARVNGHTLSREAVANECFERYKSDVMENIINRMIIQQECERRGVSVTHREIQQEVHNIAGNFNLPTENWYEMILAERGINKPQYHLDVIWPMLALKKLAGADVRVTENELQRAFIREYGPRVEARMIVVSGNFREATKIYEQARANPDDFQRLAQEHSADWNSRALGGSIPPIRRYGAPPDTAQAKIEEQAFRMQKGEISPVMQMSADRWAILKCDGHTEAIVLEMTEEVHAALMKQLVEEKTQEAVAIVFKELKSKATVQNFISNVSTAPVTQAGATRTGSDNQVQTASASQVTPE